MQLPSHPVGNGPIDGRLFFTPKASARSTPDPTGTAHSR